MLRSLAVLGFFARAVYGSFPGDDNPECQYALELVLVQDASETFNKFINNMKTLIADIVNQLGDEYPGSSFGMVKFTDKPLPGLGYSTTYGGNWATDVCYEKVVGLGKGNVSELEEAYSSFKASQGNDAREAQMEALLRTAASDDIGWTSETHDPDTGRPIARVLVLITDAKAHDAGDAQKNLDKWNAPRVWSDDRTSSTGGFGCTEFQLVNNGYFINPSDFKTYLKLSAYYERTDRNDTLTADEQADMAQLIENFGPERWDPIPTHPGDASMECGATDYPSRQQVIDAIIARELSVIVMVPTGKESSADDIINKLSDGLSVIRVSADLEDRDEIQEQFLAAISMAAELKCIPPTTTSSSTESPVTETTEAVTETTVTDTTESVTETTVTDTTESVTETTVTDTTESVTETTVDTEPIVVPTRPTRPGPTTAHTEASDPTDPTDPIVVPTRPTKPASTTGHTTEAPTEAPTDAPTEATEEGGENNSDEGDTTHPEGDTTTDGGAVPPPKNNKGVVIGAASGGAAAALIGAAAYFKPFGSLFGGSTPTGLDGGQQIEVPEEVVDRETLTTITADMFQ